MPIDLGYSGRFDSATDTPIRALRRNDDGSAHTYATPINAEPIRGCENVYYKRLIDL